MPYDYAGSEQFNLGGMWSARGLSDYDFTPEPNDDSEDLFDQNTPVPEPAAIESDEVDLGDDEEDPDGANDAALFDPNMIFKVMFDKFDTDGSGSVSKDECKALLEKVRMRL